jgi:hypothetical protein
MAMHQYGLRNLVFALGMTTGLAVAHAQDISTEAWYAVADARGIQLVNVECGEGFFDPPEIVVKSNTPVELSVRTREQGQEFVSSFVPGKAIGRQPTPFLFTPAANGRFDLVCQQQQGQGAAADPFIGGRKRGLLTVVQDREGRGR